MSRNISLPKHLRDITNEIAHTISLVNKPPNQRNETLQSYYDEILEIYKTAFTGLIESTITYSSILTEIRNAYENALQIRDSRISEFITQDRIYGISAKKRERDDTIKKLIKENEDLRELNCKLSLEVSKTKREMGKIKDSHVSEYWSLARERDARYTLYFENMQLHQKLRQLDGEGPAADHCGDPFVLRMALDKCREALTCTTRELHRMRVEYAETVPQADHEQLEAARQRLEEQLAAAHADRQALQDSLKRLQASQKELEEEAAEALERCSELERAGTPRPQWDLCADFIGGGRDRWLQLASGLSSKEKLRVLLKELGPAAESENLEYFDGLGTDPAIPPYLRYEGRVRNLRLSRREVRVIINDIWTGKAAHRDMPMREYVTKYFEDRYQLAAVRAEWAYGVCAGAESMVPDDADEGAVRVFWGALLGLLDERVHWGLRDHWDALRGQLYARAHHEETITMEEFERVCAATFPLKSAVEVRGLAEAVRRQLKLKGTNNLVHLDKLFQESEEGFERTELSRELFRQRRLAQDRYLREVVGALGPRGRNSGATGPHRLVTVEQLKRAFAIVDPAIDHVRMERHLRWAFSLGAGELSSAAPLPLRALAARLAAGDIERAGPRTKARQRRSLYK